MPDLTPNHSLQLWAAGELDWEHRDDMQYIERTMTIRDFESNLANYTPYDGARFEATDSHAIYLGDGTNWTAITPKPTADHIADTTNPHSVTATQADALPITGGTMTGDVQISGTNRITFNEGGVGESTVIHNLGSATDALEITSGNRVNILNGPLGVQGNTITAVELIDLHTTDGSGDKWHVDPRGADGDFAVEYHASGGTSYNVMEFEKNGDVTMPSGDAIINGGTTQKQRGAPTTTELADGDRMTYVSDGTDAHAAGDLVSARNAAGTIVSQVIAAAANDA